MQASIFFRPAALAALLTVAHIAAADVTINQNTTMDVSSFIHSHGSTNTAYTSDKQRRDTEIHCEGMMSIVCGNMQNGEIVRLDKSVTWTLEPKKKRYREAPFVTPEQVAAMKAQLNDRLEKMRSCPASQKQQPVDESKCKMSPPKFDVRKTGDKATIAGFDAERTTATITESCTNADTGDVCDTVVAIDAWLTQDTLPGTNDRRAFELAYAKKIGLDDMQGMFSGQMAAYLARYQDQIQQLTDKAKQFKGQPLRTSFRVLSGGPHCSAAKPDASGGQGGDSANPAADVANAGKAVGAFVGGLFKKKKQDDGQASSGDAAPSASASPAAAAEARTVPQQFPQMVQLVGFSSETVSIKTDALPAGNFDIPADWTKVEPREEKASKDEFTCPKT